MHDDLTKLAVRYGTDKFGYHDYTPNYHALFARFRDREIRMLEIGVGGYGAADRGGESLATWRDYFPQARITGIDIQRKVLDFGPRVRIFQGSQVDAAFLAQIVQQEGPFDLIVDDGSHLNQHVVETFRLLFPTLAPGGVYVVEDTQTAFFPRFGGGPDLKHPNSVGFFAQLLLRFLTGDAGPDIADTPATGLYSIERFHNMVALHKSGPTDTDPPVSWLAEPPESERVRLSQPNHIMGEQAAELTPDMLVAEFTSTPERGALLIERKTLAPEMADFLCRRFVEIDHMEQRVHFPDVPVHLMARDLRALSVTPKCIALWRAPNLYPSNFSFELDTPQAADAFARIDEIMAGGEPWPGALGLADFKLRYGYADQALDLIRRFGNGEGQPKAFFGSATRILSRTGHKEEIRPIIECGAAQYPDDPKLVSDLALYMQKDGDAESALDMLKGALEKMPRNRTLHERVGRVQFALGMLEDAATSTVMATKLTPANRRQSLMLFLAQIRLRQGDSLAALEILVPLTEDKSANTIRFQRMMTEAHVAQGNLAEALASINRALALSPEDAGQLRLREQIAAKVSRSQSPG